MLLLVALRIIRSRPLIRFIRFALKAGLLSTQRLAFTAKGA